MIISSLNFRVPELIKKDQKAAKKTFPLMNALNLKDQIATLVVLRCCFLDRFTFLDYIHAGCEISTVIGMDFTLSNKKQRDPKSLHYVNPDLEKFYDKQSQIIEEKLKQQAQKKNDTSQIGGMNTSIGNESGPTIMGGLGETDNA